MQINDAFTEVTDVQIGFNMQLKLIDQLKKENFGLKMRIYYLLENIDKLTPEGLKEIVLEVFLANASTLSSRN